MPIVEIGRKVNNPAIDVVRDDGARGVREAISHLISLGHRDIVHVDGGALPAAPERRYGYQTAMRKHNLHEKIRILPGDYTEESGVRAAQKLLAEDSLPTAVIAANDESALGLIETLIRAGVDIPSDVSVIGYDDSRLARLPFLNLTTVIPEGAGAVKSELSRLCPFFCGSWADVGVRHPQAVSRRSARSAARTNGLDTGEDGAILVRRRGQRGIGRCGVVGSAFMSVEDQRGGAVGSAAGHPFAATGGMKRCGLGGAGSIKQATTPTSWGS